MPGVICTGWAQATAVLSAFIGLLVARCCWATPRCAVLSRVWWARWQPPQTNEAAVVLRSS